jgi:hypothetical protein
MSTTTTTIKMIEIIPCLFQLVVHRVVVLYKRAVTRHVVGDSHGPATFVAEVSAAHVQ